MLTGLLCSAFSSKIFPQGVFTVWEETPEVKKTSRGHQRQVFLFQECIVLCKLKKDTGVTSDTYAFRNKMKVGFKGLFFFLTISEFTFQWRGFEGFIIVHKNDKSLGRKQIFTPQIKEGTSRTSSDRTGKKF